MWRWLRWIIALVLLALIGLSLYYWFSAPRLVSFSPADGAELVPVGAELRVEFSRPMRRASVQDRLKINPPISGVFEWQEEGRILVFRPDRPWLAGVHVQVELQAGGLSADWIAQELPQPVRWAFRVEQPRLVYLYPASGPASLYILNPVSGYGEPLPGAPLGIFEFDLVAGRVNGDELLHPAVYYSARNSQGGSDLYRLEINPVTAAQVDEAAQPSAAQPSAEPAPAPVPSLVLGCKQAQCRSPQVSPQGDYLAYERIGALGGGEPNYPRIWYLPLGENLPPTAVDEISGLPLPVLAGESLHQTLQPQWSPDGMLTFYDTVEAGFFILDLQSSQSTFFSNQTGQVGNWHPDGETYVAPEIYFLDESVSDALTDLEPLAQSHLMLFNRLNGSMTDLTQIDGLEDTSPVFSPDGRYLVLARKYLDARRWTPGRQVWLMEMSSRQAQPLTSQPSYNHFDFAWNPAGDQLAFVRFNQTLLTEPPELWLMEPLGGRAVLLVKGGYAPEWIP